MRSPDDWAAWKPSDKNDLAKIIHDNYSPYDGTRNLMQKVYSSFAMYYMTPINRNIFQFVIKWWSSLFNLSL